MADSRQKRFPKCALCVLHVGRAKAPLKNGHKKECPYENGNKAENHDKNCELCKTVFNRRNGYAEDKKAHYKPKKPGRNSDLPKKPNGVRICHKCYYGHKKVEPLAGGHLKDCPNQTCKCYDCQLTGKRRIVTTKHTTLIRKHDHGESKDHKTPTRQQATEVYSPESGYHSLSPFASPLSSPDSSTFDLEIDLPPTTIHDSIEVLNCTAKEEKSWSQNNILEMSFDEIAGMLIQNLPPETIQNMEHETKAMVLQNEYLIHYITKDDVKMMEL